MTAHAALSKHARLVVLVAAFGGLLFDGMELGLMPIASLSVTNSLLGAGYTERQAVASPIMWGALPPR